MTCASSSSLQNERRKSRLNSSIRPWIAPGYALRGAITLIAGPPSAMKSSTALAWGCSIALGIDYGRFPPAVVGPVFVYNVEDDAIEQRRRLSATLRQFGRGPADIKGALYRIGPSTIGTLLERDDNGRAEHGGVPDFGVVDLR